MQRNALKEGSLGILILLGIGVFGGVLLWLKGFRFGEDGFSFEIKFPDASGLDVGSTVRFRGVQVGKV
jgi:phospholipid/cholesterol/gamma-HCH transport system substrate-binding protein